MIVIRKPSRTVGDAQGEPDNGVASREAGRAALEDAPRAAKHPLVELGDGQTPIGYARAVLEDFGRLTVHHGHPWLNGAYATPRAILRAANSVLKQQGLPQIGKQTEWLV